MPIVLGLNGVTFPDTSEQKGAAYDTFRTSQTFLSSGSWTCPAGITLVQISLIGGGGNGGTGTQGNFSNTTFYAGGGGGGSGAIIWNYRVTVVPTTVYTVTVGAATVATSFGALMTANPGATGANAASGQSPGAGGAGGAAYNFGTPSTSPIARYETALAPVSVKGGNGNAGSFAPNDNSNRGGFGGTTPLPVGSYLGGQSSGAAATANTGAGGAGGNSGQGGGAGGSGLVIIQW